MNRESLFKFLKSQKKPDLLKILNAAFDEMSTAQKYSVFGDAIKRAKPSKVDGSRFLEKVAQFRDDSLAGVHFAPFDINSKNFSHIPEETNEWFETLNDLLLGSVQLSREGNHVAAVDSFIILYALIADMESGEEIVFAHEFGSWMIPGDESKYIRSYITSLAATKTPDEFAYITTALVRRDGLMSSTNRVYATAAQIASKEQRNALDAELRR